MIDPRPQIIIGHMGAGLPAMMAQFDQTIVDQVWVSTSGIFSIAPFLVLLQTFGADRIVFAVDYPFLSNDGAREFLDSLPVSPADRVRIAHGNADRLLGLSARPG